MGQIEYRPSSFLATKGLFSEYTYRAFQRWDLTVDFEDNIRRIRLNNTVGGPSLGWLKDFGKVLLRRFGPDGPERTLVELAQRGSDLSIWKPILLWHASKTDPLLTTFFSDWLFAEREREVVRLSLDSAVEFLRQLLATHFGIKWSEKNLRPSAGGLLRTAAEIGLLTPGRVRGFTPFHLPEEAFLYCAHHLKQSVQSTSKVVAHPAWHLFLMNQASVESELLRLHQMGKVQFDRAGTLVELRLPFQTAAEFARRMIA